MADQIRRGQEDKDGDWYSSDGKVVLDPAVATDDDDELHGEA